MIGIAGLIVAVRLSVPVPVMFLAPSVTVEVPDEVGVPVTTPVEVLMLNPEGSPDAL
jgi:hypothetical protein